MKLVFLLSLIFLFLASRMYGSEKLPLFSDEAYAILQGERLRHGAPILGMVQNTTQPVFIWFVSLFQLLPLSPIASSRMTSVAVGLATAWMLAILAGRWVHPKASWIAFLIVLVLPFSFFYDRTVLFESTVGSAIALSLLFPVIGVPLAILVKQTGWLALPLVLLTNRNVKIWIGTLSAALVVPLVVWALAYGSVNGLQSVLTKTSSAPISATVDIKSNLLRSKIWLRTYLTDPIIAVAFLGLLVELVVSVKKRTITPMFGMGIWTVGIVLFESFIARIFYPRYLYPVVIGIVLLATRGFWSIVPFVIPDSIRNLYRFRVKHGMTKKDIRTFLVIPVLLVVFLLPSFRFDWFLMTNPSVAPLALEDRYQFFEDWTSGVGSKELADAIRTYHRDIPGKLTVYLEEENSYAVTLPIELGKRQRENEIEIEIEIMIVDWLTDPLMIIPSEIQEKAPQVLFVRNRNPDIPADWPVEKIFSFSKSAVREVSLYRIVEGSDLSKDLILR